MSTVRPQPYRSERAIAQGCRVTAYARLFGAQIAIGAAAIFARFALTGTGPLVASALRLAIATVPLAALAALRGTGTLGRRAECLLALAGFALAVHFAAWLASLQYTSVAISTLLVCTSPIWAGLYEALVARRPRSRTFVAALVLAVAGAALVATRADVPAPSGGHALAGAILAASGGAAIAAYLLLVESVRRSARSGAPPTRQIVLRTYGWAALGLALASIPSGEPIPRFTDGIAWGGILAMALVSQLIGHTALNAALRDFAPSTVAMSTLLEPVAAALLAAAIFHEASGALTIFGGLLILAAIGLAAREEAFSPPSRLSPAAVVAGDADARSTPANTPK